MHRSLIAISLALAAVAAAPAAERRFPEKTWATRDAAAAGMEPAWLDRLALALGGRGCVIKDGYVVKSWGSQEEVSDWFSSAKPVLSSLLFFAIQEGAVSGPDALLRDLGLRLSQKDQAMTFRHLASMTSGYGRPEAPGAAWAYNDFAINLYQKALFDRVFRGDPDQVANDPRRFGALGLEDGLRFRPTNRRLSASVRDFARIAWFWLNQGNWNGRQVLNRRFFRDYLKPGVPAGLPNTKPAETDDYLAVGSYGGGSDQVRDTGPGNYGFNWWFNDREDALTWPDLPRDAFASLGARGNNSFIIPSLNLVLVSANGDWGSFRPVESNSRMNRHLRLLIKAATRAPAGQVSIQQYHSHDFTFAAQTTGNPFDVELTGEFTGPSGVRLRIPGFYDGDGKWKIRFSPTELGEWSLRTSSSLQALDGKTEAPIWCEANRHPEIHGGLRVDAVHPYHFVYEDGSRYFLLGYEADWLWGADMLDPKRTLMKTLISQMATRGFNHVLVNIYAHDTSWSPEKKHEWDWGPAAVYPWEGNNEKPDHSRLNPKFFQIYDGMMEALREKGIVAHIMIKVYNKKVKWPARYSRDEERYFRYVTARYQAFSNVVWDYSKEAHNEKDLGLQRRLMEFVRGHDAYRRLITTHDDDVFYWDPQLNPTVDFRTDQQHSSWPQMIAFDRAIRRYPVLNSEFGYERGVDKLPSYRTEHDWEEQLRRAWLVYMAGGYGVYYYHNTAWDVVKPEPEPPGMRRFQLLKQVLTELPYWRMEPSNHLAIGGSCLALPGEAYACYAEEGRLTLNLSHLQNPAQASAEWIDTWTGARERVAPPAAGTVRFARPERFGKAPAVLIVRNGR
jgi:CubicO group peptidase (beta-lactamase class C family)